MRYMRSLIGLAFVAAAASCGGSDQTNKGAQAPSDITAAGTSPYESQAPGSTAVNEMSGQSGASTSSTSGSAARSDMSQATAIQLVEGTFSCLLSPLTGSGGRMSGTGSSLGTGSSGTVSPDTSYTSGSMAESSSGTSGLGRSSASPAVNGCGSVAEAVSVLPTDLAKGDSAAINGVRQLIQNRLTAETASADVSDNTVALFDKGVAALKEEQNAKQALAQKTRAKADTSNTSANMSSNRTNTGTSSTGKTNKPRSNGAAPKAGTSSANDQRSAEADFGTGQDQIREHKALGELYQFGKNLGMTPTGSEAQALAWVLGVDRFITVRDLPASDKPLAAEPLFSAILEVSAPAPTAGRTAPTWNQYLAAAARSVSGSSAGTPRANGVGGGPAPTGNEKANLRDVGRAVQDRMTVIAEHLPQGSPMVRQVQLVVSDLRDFTGAGGSSTSTAPSSGQWKSGTSSGSPSSSGASSGIPKSSTAPSSTSPGGTSPSTTDSTGRSMGGTPSK